MSVVLATAGYDKKICFWEAPSGRCYRMIKFSDSQVNRLEISPDKQFIAAAGNPVIRLVRTCMLCIIIDVLFVHERGVRIQRAMIALF